MKQTTWEDEFRNKFEMKDWKIYVAHATEIEEQLKFISKVRQDAIKVERKKLRDVINKMPMCIWHNKDELLDIIK